MLARTGASRIPRYSAAFAQVASRRSSRTPSSYSDSCSGSSGDGAFPTRRVEAEAAARSHWEGWWSISPWLLRGQDENLRLHELRLAGQRWVGLIRPPCLGTSICCARNGCGRDADVVWQQTTYPTRRALRTYHRLQFLPACAS